MYLSPQCTLGGRVVGMKIGDKEFKLIFPNQGV